jgi:hypothetical protein
MSSPRSASSSIDIGISSSRAAVRALIVSIPRLGEQSNRMKSYLSSTGSRLRLRICSAASICFSSTSAPARPMFKGAKWKPWSVFCAMSSRPTESRIWKTWRTADFEIAYPTAVRKTTCSSRGFFGSGRSCERYSTSARRARR